MNKKQKMERLEKMKVIFPVISQMRYGFSNEMAAAIYRFCIPAKIKFNLLDHRDCRWFLHDDAMEYFFPKPKVKMPRLKKPKKLDLTRTCKPIAYFK